MNTTPPLVLYYPAYELHMFCICAALGNYNIKRRIMQQVDFAFEYFAVVSSAGKDWAKYL
jgi:hypothetical protein